MVESMRRGMSPTEAVEEALNRIDQYYPAFQGALVAVDTSGNYGKHSRNKSLPMQVRVQFKNGVDLKQGYRSIVEAEE